jgi:hypothetical protein
MQSKIFRKIALDKLSSPEQLDQLMQITTPKAWLALVALGGLLMGVFIWSIFGSIPTEVTGEGMLVTNPASGLLEAVAYVELAQGSEIRTGMEVEIELATVRPENDGYLRGRVLAVGDRPVTRQQAAEVLGSEELAAAFLPDTPAVEVRLELLTSAKTRSGYAWTSENGPDTAIAAGTPCTIRVVVNEERPISRVLPVFERLDALSPLRPTAAVGLR